MKGYWVVKVNVLHPDKQKLYAEYATEAVKKYNGKFLVCLLYTSPSPRD